LEYFVVAALRRIHVDVIHHDLLSLVLLGSLDSDAEKLKFGGDLSSRPPGRVPTSPQMSPLAHREQCLGYRRHRLWHQRSISLVPLPETRFLGNLPLLERRY